MQGGIEVPATGPVAPAPAPTNGERPAWLPENFKSPEELANSYKSLQAEYTKLKQGVAPTEPKVPEAKPVAPNNGDLTIDQKAAEAVTSAGLNFDQLADEFMAEGTLKDESYAALEKAGIPKPVVDEFIRLKQGEAQAIRSEVLSIAGGEESFQQMIQWAATNYQDAAAYNAAMNSGDAAQMRMAMTALKMAYTSANGSDPKLVMGNGSATTGDVYVSDLEMVADMQKPQYRSDPAFRREVQEKVARTLASR